ncbi:MAG: hypothetical protein H0V01_08335 [Bacteroidetes bacterium]|nr:hypothetical protein [Bacteroidota bacterium]HET6243715.1 hypothetical protein [Bacteroidia bacterium]
MAYSHKNSRGQTYYLHSRKAGRGGTSNRDLFFFAKEPRESALDKLPEGYEVIESERTGLPILKKTGGSSKAAKTATKAKIPETKKKEKAK